MGYPWICLQRTHQSATLSSSLKNLEGWQKFRLSQEQIAGFNERGYLAGVQVLNDRQIDLLCAELAGLMKKSLSRQLPVP